MGSLDQTVGAGGWSVALQAACFGAAHFVEGFPSGWLGFAMASVYGAMMGMVCRRSGGLLAPWIAHVGADLTIFALLAARPA
jgi:membrane protease YdiL (CAAX protease family)